MKNFIKHRSAATSIEYGLISSLVAVVIVAGVSGTGNNLKDTFCKVASYVSNPSGDGSDNCKPPARALYA